MLTQGWAKPPLNNHLQLYIDNPNLPYFSLNWPSLVVYQRNNWKQEKFKSFLLHKMRCSLDRSIRGSGGSSSTRKIAGKIHWWDGHQRKWSIQIWYHSLLSTIALYEQGYPDYFGVLGKILICPPPQKAGHVAPCSFWTTMFIMYVLFLQSWSIVKHSHRISIKRSSCELCGTPR